MSKRADEDKRQYSEQETQGRREAALKKMLATPPQPHAEQKPSPVKTKAK